MEDTPTGSPPSAMGNAGASIYVPATGQDGAVLDQAKDAAASLKSAGNAAAAQAQDQAASLVGQIKDKALTTANQQKEGLADRIDDLAGAVHQSGKQFAGQQDWIASAIEEGAAELGALASSLRQNDFSGLLDQVTGLARRQPALFVGASLAAGFAVARLGKMVAADVSRDDLPTIPEVGHGGR